MGIACFILGHSGTGKSSSLRNFKSDEILHINVMSKPLPFKGRFAETYNGDNYIDIADKMNGTKKKVIVIDDAQYLMADEFMRRSSEAGYQKFTDIGFNFWTLINSVTTELPFDVIVYFLMHTDMDDNGNEKAKTIGKLLDEKICIEGMSSIVLKTAVKDGVYSFLTQNNGHDTVKSPLGMFSTYEIENDLKKVDTAIREYWELDVPFESSKEIMAAHDKEVDAGGISTDAPQPEKRTRRRRGAETPTDGEKSEDKEITPPERKRRRTRTESPAEIATEIEKVSDMIESAESVETYEEPARRRRRRVKE